MFTYDLLYFSIHFLIMFLNPILATVEYDKVTKPQSTSCQNLIKKAVIIKSGY